MQNQPVNYPVIVWTEESMFRENRSLSGGKEFIEGGYFDHAALIDRNGDRRQILTASCGRIHFEGILGFLDSISPAARSYIIQMELSQPEQLDLETTKQQIVDCILEKRWHHTGQGISSSELLAPIREARSFEELVDKFDYPFGN